MSGELHVDVVANDIGVVVEYDIEVQPDEVTYNRGVGRGGTSGNVIKVEGLALGPAHSGCGGTHAASVELHLHKGLFRCNCLECLDGDLHLG